MASTQMIRVDAYGLLPTVFIVLMLILAFLGVMLATINVVGGYAVTQRMLLMFKKKQP